MITVNYNLHGETYTEQFTPEQVREELKQYGHPEAMTMSDGKAADELKEILNY